MDCVSVCSAWRPQQAGAGTAAPCRVDCLLQIEDQQSLGAESQSRAARYDASRRSLLQDPARPRPVRGREAPEDPEDPVDPCLSCSESVSFVSHSHDEASTSVMDTHDITDHGIVQSSRCFAAEEVRDVCVSRGVGGSCELGGGGGVLFGTCFVRKCTYKLETGSNPDQ